MYFIARQTEVNASNPYGWRPAQGRMLHTTKREAVDALALVAFQQSAGAFRILDADHEPGRSILATQCGP